MIKVIILFENGMKKKVKLNIWIFLLIKFDVYVCFLC